MYTKVLELSPVSKRIAPLLSPWETWMNAEKPCSAMGVAPSSGLALALNLGSHRGLMGYRWVTSLPAMRRSIELSTIMVTRTSSTSGSWTVVLLMAPPLFLPG